MFVAYAITYLFSHLNCCSFLPWYGTWVLNFANDISVSSTEISLIFICYRLTAGFAVLLPGLAVLTPGLCRRCPEQSRGVSGRTGTHRSASWATPGMNRGKLGQTVITFCPKPGLVCSAAGNVWTHSKSSIIRPGSPRSAGYKLPGRTGAYTGRV